MAGEHDLERRWLRRHRTDRDVHMMGRFGRRLEWKQIRRPGIQTGKGEQSKLPAGSSVGIGHASQRTIVTKVPGADMWRAKTYTMWRLWTDRGSDQENHVKATMPG